MKTFFIHEGPRRGTKNTFLSAKGREENLLWSTQIMVVDHENHSRNGPILPVRFLLL